MRLRTKLLAAATGLSAAIYATPWVAYAVGLSLVEGRPIPPKDTTLSDVQRQYLQKEFRFDGPIVIQRQSPWSYVLALATEDLERLKSEGSQVAWIVASHHNLKHRKGGMGWWHFSGAALTIWVTRHWSSEEILAAVMVVAREEKWRSHTPTEALACIKPEGSEVEVAGLVSYEAFPGPPNYESVKGGDSEEGFWFVTLDQPLCVQDEKDGASKFQLFFEPGNEGYKALKAGHRFRIGGVTFMGISGHHRTPIVIEVSSVAGL